MYVEQLSKAAGIKLNKKQALKQLQNNSDKYGCLMVEVLPVEKTSAIVGVYGNKVNNEREHWLAKILTVPKKWHVSDTFWRSRVKNDWEVESAFTEGENVVYSEFAGRNIVKTTLEMTFQTQEKDGMVYGYEFMSHHCEPLIDIPFGVGSIIVCPPHVLKKFDRSSRGGVMQEVSMPVPVSLEEIFGYMVDDTFEPFLHIVVKKVRDEIITDLVTDHVKKHKSYLQYKKGAIFLPLEKDCYIFTNRGNEIPQKGSKHPATAKFIYKHKYHEYDLVLEDESILAYTEKGQWKPTPTVIVGTEVDSKEVMKYLYNHETKIEFTANEAKHYKVEGVDGYCLFAKATTLEYRGKKMSYALQRRLIGRLSKGENGVEISMAADKVAFDIDLAIHFGKLTPPVNIQESYSKGKNVLNIDTVISKNGEGLYFFEKPAYGFIQSGWTVNGVPPFSFWYTQRSRITAIIDYMEKITVLGNRVLVKLIQKDTTDSGIVLVGTERITDLAEVVALGTTASGVKVGDKVMLNKLALSSPISWDNTTCYFVRDNEITAILE